MKQLLKKSLACVVSLALGVTMLAGAVTISRADVTPTITVATVTVEPGATQVNVPVTLAGMNDVAGYSGTVTLDNALTLEGINDASGRFVTSGNNQNTYVNGNTVSFAEVLNGFGAAAVTEMGFTLVVTAPQAEETYPITVTTCFCNIDEQILSVNATNGAVIVEAPVVHEHTYSGYSSDADGHWQVCTECAESTAKVAHTYDAGVITTQPGHETDGVRTYTCTVCGYQTTEVVGATGHTYSDAWSYDETNHWHDCTANDGAKDALAAHTYDDGVVTTAATSTTPGVMTYTCTVCGRSYTEEIPASHIHAFTEFVTAIPATGSDTSANTEYTKGSITLRCECGETATHEVNYSYFARASYINMKAETETLLVFNARENDLVRTVRDGTTGVANITDGFIVLDQVRGEEQVEQKIVALNDLEYEMDAGARMSKIAPVGIVGFAMADEVTSTVYAYDSVTDAWYSGYRAMKSIKSLTESVLPSATTSQKTMLVDLLNYGAKAQLYFNQNTENLANADIDAYQSFATTSVTYGSEDYSMPVTVNNENVFSFFFYKYDMLAESKLTNRIYFRLPKNYSEASTPVDMTGYTVQVTYTAFDGQEIVEEYTADKFESAGSVNRYYVDVAFRSPDLRSVASYVVKSPLGQDIGPIASMSFSNLVARTKASASNANQIAMFDALIAFSDSANAFLAG